MSKNVGKKEEFTLAYLDYHALVKDIKFWVGIDAYKGADQKRTGMITDRIIMDLQKIEGKHKIIDLKKKRTKKNVNLMIMGSVKKLGSK